MPSRGGTPGVEDLQWFRNRVYGCFTRRADALFGLVDAVLCAPGRVHTVAELSLSPVFGRGHGSAYAALADGVIDVEAVQDAVMAHRRQDWPLWFALDLSSWARPYAKSSPQRGWVHHSMRHTNGRPFVPGWQYQWLVQLSGQRDSWTAPLQAVRVPPQADVATQAGEQIRACVERLGHTDAPPLFVLDAGYDPVALSWLLWQQETPGPRASLLVRLRADRVFYRDPGPRRPGQKGPTPRHGARFALTDPGTWATPDAEHHTHDPHYGHVRVTAWHRLHPALYGQSAGGRYQHLARTPIVEATIIRVHIQNPPRRNGATHTLWLWHTGQPTDLDTCWRAYLRRFDIEHTFKYAKTHLGWLAPTIRHPEQADRWTWLILTALTQLRLAKPHTAGLRLPWQPRQPAHRLTPGRVRSGFPHLHATIGTPAKPRRNFHPGPGRPKGTPRGPAPRHPVIKKPHTR
ncbi:NF041680 family putative transposase [Micromonospora sp. NPDC049275]|uniref:NF041680 family putative transposase n=1 Tax=Micromonospora sp. NPDC049275 TaxID=3364268 RepID=UPI0037246D2D